MKLFYPLVGLLILIGCSSQRFIKPTEPSHVSQNPEFPSLQEGDQVISHVGYSLVFDKANKVAKWISYSLSPEKLQKLGSVKRKDNWHTDEQVPESPSPNDYKYSGYDRGHLAPAQDMSWSKEAMYDSFAMTNAAPQTIQLNRGIWKSLEGNVRKWAKENDFLNVTTGPVLSEGCIKKLLSGICVPKSFFKVVRASKATEIKTKGFIIPNGTMFASLDSYELPVSEVENKTGLHFHSDASETFASPSQSRTEEPLDGINVARSSKKYKSATYGSGSPPVKKSKNDICHERDTTYYNRTKNFTAYDSIEDCIESGGRLPKR